MNRAGLTVLEDISWKADIDGLMKRFCLQPDSPDAKRVEVLARQAEEIGRPKVLYKEAHVEDKGEDYVIVDGVRLTSRVLRINLEGAYRVFPYIATSGTELERWSENIDDILERYWADTIKEIALYEALRAFEKHLDENFNPGRTSSMNPGSLGDWPICQQRQLFKILGHPERYIGVKLTESYLMLPIKSLSGIRFSTQIDFENCKLCSRKSCSDRRVPYDPELARSYGI